ncbi:hypothetical protein WJ0W_004113 [Paenibacillus melissococcoides]|uniref:Uncharacterized protein n=1 Tax=Paenibacillus melissococcoides TaxID=2912268 RepID=A0ABN8U776_9BACL|nr:MULTISPECIES: hypothetical protein [Paenibacillus]GIO79028.1 hypothetical protein J6TS7_26380 [Paenibacillus dendritiformis]CAH8246881.1 hypothetical protein WJ0W_004113 [Paenibacillus melissococcoides]CAH8716085.1 hypothetical protein HTL2_004486 [Paenibacillus melissococcoides]CAH8717069.1 hypothetical protein WDD9_004759 [Paenibacillus melissococcoides]
MSKEKGNLIVWGTDSAGDWNALHTNVAEEEAAEILSKYPSYDGFKWASRLKQPESNVIE